MKKRLKVFGKANCPKCAVLKKRLGELVKDDEISYVDIAELAGIVELCKYERLNPNRIPMVIIETRTDSKAPFQPLNGKVDEDFPYFAIYGYKGLLTNYEKGGVLSPEMLSLFIEKHYKNAC